MRKLYWYLTAYIKKHGLTFVLSVIGAILIFSLLMPALAKKISFKKKNYIGIVGEFTLQNLPDEIKNNLSVGLTMVDAENQSIKPLLAERWVTENEGKTYRFIIKKGVKWQDGEELTPDDINYNFNDVETISTPNDIIFKLPDTFAPFPSVVTEPLLKHTVEPYLTFFKRPTVIGIGPYKVSSYKLQGNRLKQITLQGPDDILVYRFYLTDQNAIIGFKKGEVDHLLDVKQYGDLKEWSDDSIVIGEKINYDHYLAVFFNHNDPVLTKNIKQSLAYATSNPSGDIKAIGPINPNSWAYLEAGKDYSRDLDRAVERLLSDVPNEPLEFTLTTTNIYQQKAEDIIQEWDELSKKALEECQSSSDVENKDLCPNLKITTHLKVTNFPDLQNFQLLLIGQEIPIDPDQYFLWHSDQGSNFSNYSNTRIDSLLETGRQTLEQSEREVIYQEFQQYLLEDPAAIFLEHLVSYDVRRV